MDLWLTHCTLAALIFPLIFPGTQGTTAELRNGTAIKNTILEPGQSFKRLDADVHPSALERSDAKAGGVSGGEDNAKRSLVKISEGRTGSTESSTVTSSQTSDSPSTDSSFKDHSSRPNVDNESSICKGCGEEGNVMRMPPVRSLLSDNNGEEEEPVTRMVWPFSREALDLEIRKKLLKSGIVRESQEDYGSGYHHVQEKGRWETHPSSLGKERDLDEFMEKATASPSQTTITLHSELSSPSTEKAISPDSAEIDHLLQVSSETVLQTPSPSQDQMNEKAKTEVGFEVGKSQEPRIVSEKAARGVEGSPDIAMVTEKIPSASGPSVQPVNPDKPSEAPPEHSVDDPINFDYYDLFEGHEDGDEEGGVDDDDDDDDIEDTEDAEDDDTGARELVNVPRSATLMPKIQTIMVGEKPTGRQHTPHQTYILYGGEVHPKFHPEINKDLTQTISGSNDSSAECRNGYVRRNNSCKSVCDLYPTYCYNGGQCYIVENMGAFCR
ncbi:hypothetical protein GDO86_019289 [Hymenochirus boettgeri]|uniref:Uncharacterized protein n=1 Tax=Hymenochirus boettgeri TaxID=247094 RepID=A0A8T2IGS6_9PIPI|nr:hypothetical protein GDO86_019289 [Hymenochirus boettgeri]